MTRESIRSIWDAVAAIGCLMGLLICMVPVWGYQIALNVFPDSMWRSDQGVLVIWVLIGFSGLLWCFMVAWTAMNLLQLFFNVHPTQEEPHAGEASD